MLLLVLWAARNRAARSRRPSKMPGFVRLLFFGAAVGLALGALSAHASMTHASEASMALGRELAGITGLPGETNRVILNGERIAIERAISREEVERALDHFLERSCPHGELGVFRRATSKDEAVAFCLPSLAAGAQAASMALARFVETGDLEDLGGIHYAYARREPDGATSLLVAWSEGSFRPGRVAWNDDGDAPGSDSSQLPRPPRSRRLLSARIDGAPYSLRLYEVANVGAALLAYDREMPALGWTRIDDGANTRVFVKGAVHVFVASSLTPEGKAVLTLGELGDASKEPEGR